ncbi:hypothetical protein Agabi119p4_7877 [Agaricus bisporus var. burnettii]|uniref:Uncharacterized protein n=1 Tax=Agaricus bisporus var. burnettii TaxID=192524 RepID=A0A8H7EZC7_AGABI|nr:hypothetical protein Agabi119p4_7877 [Agaricus bisporus var. burnettii]
MQSHLMNVDPSSRLIYGADSIRKSILALRQIPSVPTSPSSSYPSGKRSGSGNIGAILQKKPPADHPCNNERVTRFGSNLARPRFIPKQITHGVKAHRSVKMRVEAEYEDERKRGKRHRPKAQLRVEPTCID